MILVPNEGVQPEPDNSQGLGRYLNNLTGDIIGFRNDQVAAKGDMRKMYNAVLLEESDCFGQCFLWRHMNDKKMSETFQVIVNNIGVKLAGLVAKIALYKSAKSFVDRFLEVVEQLKSQIYVDHIGLTDRVERLADKMH